MLANPDSVANYGIEEVTNHYRNIIKELNDKEKGMTNQQKLATAAQVLGLKPAQKLFDVIKAGPKALENYTNAAKDQTKMTKAAGDNANTVGGQFHVMEGKLTDLADKVGPVILPFIKLAIKNFGLWVDAIGAVTNNIQKVAGYVEGFGKTVTKAFDSVKKDLGELAEKFVTAFQDPGTMLENVGKALIDGLWKGFIGAVPGLLGEMKHEAGHIVGAVGKFFGFGSPSTETIPFGQSMIDGLTEGMKDSSSAALLLAAATATANKVLTTIKSFVPEFQSVGQQLMEGLAAGITAAAGQVATAAEQAAQGAVTAAKTATKTSSPSQVFQEMGVNFMQGLALGITGAAGLASSAMRGAVGGLQGPAALGGRGAAGSGMTIQMNAPLVQVTSPSGTLPASTIEQVGAVVQEQLHQFADSWGNALRVSGS